MRSIQTKQTFPLSSVKPLEWLSDYRDFCLSTTRQLLDRSSPVVRRCPLGGEPLEPVGEVEGLAYALCRESGSIFLSRVADAQAWGNLLAQTQQFRSAPDRLHGNLSQSRTDNVYAPKVDWIQETLTLQGIRKPRILQAVTPPSELSALLKECNSFAAVQTAQEMELAHRPLDSSSAGSADAVVLLESLDRVSDPAALLRAVSHRLVQRGLLFVTALVSSGFDLQTLGLKNLYLYPPDRTNCFSLRALQRFLEENGFKFLEISTPGVLDVEIVQAHRQMDPSISLSNFERELLDADEETRSEFQSFLQRRGLSSFARLVAKKI